VAHDPRVPWYAKVTARCVVAYALSPIDLIPDFVPVLGLLDDAVIVPLGILLVVKMIPDEILVEHRTAADFAETRPQRMAGAVAIVAIWITLAVAAGLCSYRYFHRWWTG